ncbi:hypothetical protein HDV63DRAFT_411704 [Trichoderma sp. SZMC 28014]
MSPQGRRSKFPLHNGYLVLLSQFETESVEVQVSYNSNPQSATDFSPLLKRRISYYGVGWTCFKIPDAPQGMDAGANATFQMRLASSWETPVPRSYFSCADITYVEREGLDFPDAQFPCINTTDVEWEDLPMPTKKINAPKPTTTPWSPSEKKGKKLNSGIIALISIIGALVIMGVIVGIYRLVACRRKKKEKERQEEAPFVWVPGTYGLPGYYTRPIRRGQSN